MHVRDDDSEKYLYSSVVYRDGRDTFYLRCVCEEQQNTLGLDVDALLPKVGTAQQGEESLAAGALGGPPLKIDPEQAYPHFDPKHVTKWVSSSTKDAPVFPKSFCMLFYADPVAHKKRCSWIESVAPFSFRGAAMQQSGAALGRWPRHPRVARGTHAPALEKLVPQRHVPAERHVEGTRPAVLIDVDSCLPMNEPLGRGMLLNKDATKSCPANDWLGLELVEKHLRSFFLLARCRVA